MTFFLEEIIWLHEEECAITLSGMCKMFDSLIFDLPTTECSVKVFEAIPSKHKSDYYDHLVKTFDNNTPANQFISVGSSTKIIPPTKKELKEEKLKLVRQIENIRLFLSAKKKK